MRLRDQNALKAAAAADGSVQRACCCSTATTASEQTKQKSAQREKKANLGHREANQGNKTLANGKEKRQGNRAAILTVHCEGIRFRYRANAACSREGSRIPHPVRRRGGGLAARGARATGE
jgi:hypothetical protein